MADHIGRLREKLQEHNLAGFIVPRADEHQGEYVAPNSERLKWLTGFGGSAGRAVILAEHAALFVDGRYMLEAAKTLPPSIETRHFIREGVGPWLREHAAAGKLGYDPWHSTHSQTRELNKHAEAAGFTLAAVTKNPVDEIWNDRPDAPATPVRKHPPELAGEDAEKKCARIAGAVAEAGADVAVLTLPASVAWLFNARADDLPCVPVALSFAALHKSGKATWFIDESRLAADLRESLEGVVEYRRPRDFTTFLSSLGGSRVLIDPDTAPQICFQILTDAGAEPVHGADPCLLPKARKNGAELAAIREAHRQDGAALCRFLHWLEAAVPGGGVSELGAARRLYEMRAENANCLGLSFETISGSGPNGAIMHYRVDEESDRPLRVDEPYLVDSGAQYPGGTTDVTRTVCFAEPGGLFRRRYTQVLQGHIEVARARFPSGVTGAGIDALARQFLWRDGVDYDHGTGHGVGAYLCVHEGPQGLTSRSRVPLEAGMVVSNEPGYYEEGAYGIRIENLVEVCDFGDSLGFSTLTLAPIQRELIDADLLSSQQREWLNDYHARVREEIAPRLDDAEVVKWLERSTTPV